MTNNYSFQMDITDPSYWSIIHRLQSVFQNANPANPTQTFEAMQHVLGDANVIDHSVHPDSPRRDRPAYLDDHKEQFQHARTRARPLTKIDPATPKDWDVSPKAVTAPKDWSALGR
jgi:hypothetical protein